ncbi:DUF1449 family protein [Aurantiacibacter xanthus]|uniref:DUF1449 family protein n=1 Tax=Aurantiacibacter xanthus TaxID=1784712 RepID=A0A3A1P765_9SPHN|nr:OB-fold-containig protein [Aurantiacibacter xanthus]RIV88667.1 DUF1449 family protein [Aurantiacibacter xanthus]
MSLLAAHNVPFAAALLLMLLLAAFQLVSFGGFDLDADGDAGLDADGEADAAGGLLSLLGIGRLPFTIWLVLFLLVFAGIGVSIQALAQNLTGGPLHALLAAVLAGAAALPVTGVLTRPLAKILPHDETSAVGLDSLVGRRAVITTGVARAGSPARARVADRHGHPHHVMVVPHEPASELGEGDEVLLVRREDNLFYAVPLQERLLAPLV